MKKTLYTLFLITTLSAVSFSQSTTTMQDIMETVTDKVKFLEDQKNQELVNITLDLIVGKGKKTVLRNLDPSFEYDVMLLGDRRISKLKIGVRKKDSAGNWVDVDIFSDSSPTLRIKPDDFVQYEFTISVDEFKEMNNVGHFAMLLYHKDPEKNR